MKWTLKNIAELLKQPVPQSGDQQVNRLSVDSRTITEGMVFVALKGERYDGHLFVEEVFEKKAGAAIVEQAWHDQCGHRKEGVLFSVENPLSALQEIAAHYRKQLDIPIIVLSQLSRDVEKTGREPVLSDLRDSGSLEQDASLVMFLHEDDESYRIIVAKNRKGKTGRIDDIKFVKRYSRFEELEYVDITKNLYE